jgi:drug/metabolite transporter (DMT)-like permease
MNTTSRAAGASPVMIALAMGALYFFWGSTYYGIKVAVEGYPPFFMAAVRNIIAGLLIYAFVRARGSPPPPLGAWKRSAIIGGLLLLGGNGLVTFASQYAPSGLIAVIVAMLPLWMVLLDRPRNDDGTRARISPIILTGVLVGLTGVILLIAPKIAHAFAGPRDGVHTMEAVAVGAALISSLSWATGSIYSRRSQNPNPRWPVRAPASPFRDTGMQLICGGALLMIASVIVGEPWRLRSSVVFASPWPTVAVAYLIVFGSLVGYSAYIWLLGVIPAARVATYAYVNPVVALLIGWAVGGEALSGRTMLAASIIIGSVAVIVTARASAPPAAPGDQPKPAENPE